MLGLIGKKIGMTTIFNEKGEFVPVTVIEAGPCPIVQVKSEEGEGYKAIQLGFEEKRKSLFNKPVSGHFEKNKIEPKRILKEMRIDDLANFKVGQELKVDIFSVGEKVNVIGTSKGLGFQGAVRRYKFAGGPKTHGQSDRLRAPGSVGGSSYPSRTWKGQKMAGRMGNEKVTLRNLLVVGVDKEKNLLLIRGAVPGKTNGILTIKKIKK
jgi:large subunit ribosomal protein L3